MGSSMTENMRHLVIESPNRLAWRETQRPTLQSGLDAIVRPIVVGRCDLDVGLVRGLAAIGFISKVLPITRTAERPTADGACARLVPCPQLRAWTHKLQSFRLRRRH
jgi:hypothetical protein